MCGSARPPRTYERNSCVVAACPRVYNASAKPITDDGATFPARRLATTLHPMKAVLISIGIAILAGLAFSLAGRPLDAADYVVILLVGTLLAWTYEQYHHPDSNQEQ